MEVRRLKKSVVYLMYSLGFVLLVGIAYLIEGAFTTNSLDDDTLYVSDTIFDEVLPVVAAETKIVRPYKDSEITILKDFYDYQADESSQEKAIINYNNTYLQSSGVSYGGKDDFDVTAILDGKVISVENDETLGTTVQIEHDNNIISVYQSLKDVTLKENDKISQGDVIGKSSTSNLDKDLGSHLYFELIVNGKTVDPENYFDKSLSEL